MNELTNLQRKRLKIYKTSDLRRIYNELCRVLNERNGLEVSRTSKELEFERLFRSVTRRSIVSSLWIGRRNIDFFVPNVGDDVKKARVNGVKRGAGLVVEIDGDVHNEYTKMKRDSSKYEDIHSLNIMLYTIENTDLMCSQVTNFFDAFEKYPLMDSRRVDRVWRRVYLKTIACNSKLVREAQIEGSNHLLLILKCCV